MISVDLSNIWSSVSLPDLLSGEKDLFDAHLLLRANEENQPRFLGWLAARQSAMMRAIHEIRSAAERIRQQSDTLVVLGSGGPFLAAQAGVGFLGALSDSPRMFYAGDSLSTNAWLSLCEQLEDHNFSLQLISGAKPGLAASAASRSLRWLLERRYGPEAKSRVYVSAPAGSALHSMAKEEGFTFLPQPTDPGCTVSALSPAALLPMAVAGTDPLSVVEGAAQADQDYDLRAFENPVWMYAGARYALANRGRTNEFLLTPGRFGAFGAWWRHAVLRRMCQAGMGVLPAAFPLPQSLDALDAMLTSGRYPVFQTLLRPAPNPAQRLHVELDWKDYDGLGHLADTALETVADRTLDAYIAAQDAAGVPLIQLDCAALDAPQAGELFYFFELSNAICAAASGVDPLAPKAPSPARVLAAQALGQDS